MPKQDENFSSLSAAKTTPKLPQDRQLRLALLAVALGDNFFGPNEVFSPEKTALHPHDYPAILLRIVGRFITDDPMKRSIEAFFVFYFLYFEAMKNLQQRMH